MITFVRWKKSLKYCSKCGTEIDEGVKFCPKCGRATSFSDAHSKSAPLGKSKKKPISTMAIVLIVIVAAVVVIGLISTVFFFGGWSPFGEVVGSGNLVTNEQLFSDFTSVDARSGFLVEISKSNEYSILVTTDDNVMEFIEITKSGETLNIGVKWGSSIIPTTMKVEITMPELDSLELSGGSQGKLEEFIVTNSFSIDLSGGSSLVGLGEANDFTISASGGSILDFSDFSANDVNVELSGGSQATINIDGTLDADLSGGSRLFYIGEPTLNNIETTSGSTISKK